MFEIFKKGDKQAPKDSKKQIENIVTFIIILIVTVLVINNIWKDDKTGENEESESSKILAKASIKEPSAEYDELETRLASILESIEGVGKVKVLIKYSETSTLIPVYNETSSESITEESDGDGGIKSVTENDSKKEVVYIDENNQNSIITQKVTMPVIEGTVVTAQGASNSSTKNSIVSAVEAITGLAVHKIQVFEMGE